MNRSAVVAWIGIPRAPHIRDRKLWSFSIALSVAGFGLYALYRREHVAEFSSELLKVFKASRNAVDVVTSLSEISHRVLSDLNIFLQSDKESVPLSIRQITTLLSTQEFQNATRTLVMAFFEGLAKSGGYDGSQSTPVLENLVERIMLRATRRPDLMSLVVRLTTRHATDEILSLLTVLKAPLSPGRGSGSALDLVLSRVASESGRKIMSSVVTAFTSTLVTVCLDKASGVNSWDEVFRVVSRPASMRLIQQVAGVSSREFAKTVIEGLNGTRSQSRSAVCTEITAEVDYSAVPAQVSNIHSIKMKRIAAGVVQVAKAESSHASKTVSNLVESFVDVAKNEDSREVLYKFCGKAMAEVIKLLLLDFIHWFRRSVFQDAIVFTASTSYQFLIMCAVIFSHVSSTGLAIQPCT